MPNYCFKLRELFLFQDRQVFTGKKLVSLADIFSLKSQTIEVFRGFLIKYWLHDLFTKQ